MMSKVLMVLALSEALLAPQRLTHSARRATRASAVTMSASKKILVLGGDGFCGWPTALHLSDKGHDVGRRRPLDGAPRVGPARGAAAAARAAGRRAGFGRRFESPRGRRSAGARR